MWLKLHKWFAWLVDTKYALEVIVNKNMEYTFKDDVHLFDMKQTTVTDKFFCLTAVNGRAFCNMFPIGY